MLNFRAYQLYKVYRRVFLAEKHGALQTLGCDTAWANPINVSSSATHVVHSIVAGLFHLVVPLLPWKGRYLRVRQYYFRLNLPIWPFPESILHSMRRVSRAGSWYFLHCCYKLERLVFRGSLYTHLASAVRKKSRSDVPTLTWRLASNSVLEVAWTAQSRQQLHLISIDGLSI